MRVSRPRLPRVPPLALLVIGAMLLALGGAWLWLRDSSLVAVQRVTVTGASGPDARQIRAALIVAGRNMTTLDVQMSTLKTAVSPFPVVKDLQVSTSFPHGLKIRVVEQIPVATLVSAGRRLVVAGDGTLLREVAPSPSLPTVAVPLLPGGSRLTDAHALEAVAVLAAAPYQLLSHAQQVTTNAAHGVVVQLRDGPSLYFGDPVELSAKWLAATGVLADSGSVGATYIDVSDPYRPAAGVGASSSPRIGSAAPAATGAASGATGATAGAATGGTVTPGLGGTHVPGSATAGAVPAATPAGVGAAATGAAAPGSLAPATGNSPPQAGG